jgi:hypothetical protein
VVVHLLEVSDAVRLARDVGGWQWP